MNNENDKKGQNTTNINWYPGHMVKTKREIKESISLIDIVLEIVDARIPFSSHIEDIEEYTKNKEKIIVFSKYDLCDKKETEKWVYYYENHGFEVVTCNSKEGNDYKKIINKIDELMKSKNLKRKEKGLLPKKAKVLVVGVPNVGKSTLINKLVNKKITDVGNKPGITRSLKTIRVNELIDLVDTPGILWPKLKSEEEALNLASMTIIKEEIIPVDKVAIHILQKLNEFYPEALFKEFGIENIDLDFIDEVYKTISKKIGLPIRNDEPDYDRISLYVLNTIKSEKIKNITFDRLLSSK